jgi:hypothetical protein
MTGLPATLHLATEGEKARRVSFWGRGKSCKESKARRRTHHLLGHEDLRRRDLDTEVATGDHDTVGDGEDLVKVDDALLVLNLDDDLDAGALGAEDLADGEDVLGRADERGKDHVDAVLDTELEVLLVLLGQGREVDRRLGQVDTLARAERAVVDGLDLEAVALDGEDLEREDAVVDVDVLARRGDLGEVLLQKDPRNEAEASRRTSAGCIL